MAIYDLTQQQLSELPQYAQKAFPYNVPFYALGDVQNKARKVHGDAWKSGAKTRTFVGWGASKLSDAEKMRLRMRIEARNVITKVSEDFWLKVWQSI